MLQPFRRQAYKLIVLQCMVIIILCCGWWLFGSVQAGYSALFGGLAGIIPNIYFVNKLFSDKERSYQRIALDFYLGECLKLLLSAVLLVLIFKFIPVKLIPLISGFIGAYMAVRLVPIILCIKGTW